MDALIALRDTHCPGKTSVALDDSAPPEFRLCDDCVLVTLRTKSGEMVMFTMTMALFAKSVASASNLMNAHLAKFLNVIGGF